MKSLKKKLITHIGDEPEPVVVNQKSKKAKKEAESTKKAEKPAKKEVELTPAQIVELVGYRYTRPKFPEVLDTDMLGDYILKRVDTDSFAKLEEIGLDNLIVATFFSDKETEAYVDPNFISDKSYKELLKERGLQHFPNNLDLAQVYHISPEFNSSAQEYIKNTYGNQYLGSNVVKSAKGQIQDAHEAIRPTSISRTPDSIKSYLSKDEYNLYKLIYNRALASLMSANEYELTTIRLENGNTIFKSNTELELFDGYFVIYKATDDEDLINKAKLPSLSNNDIFYEDKVELLKHTTQPPAHYTEGKVVKLMEELGIGRPSTYASTISLLLKRGYIKSEKHFLIPQQDGKLSICYLDEFFIRIIN